MWALLICVSVSQTGFIYTASEGMFSKLLVSRNLCANAREAKRNFYFFSSSLLISKSLNYIMSDCQHGFSSLKRQNKCTKICIFFAARSKCTYTPSSLYETHKVWVLFVDKRGVARQYRSENIYV